jgi:uncharacterized repeat protein (TIGR03803 family)
MCAAATLCFVSANLAWSQSYKVIYAFGEQAKNPSSGLVVDAAGNAYGTTAEGGYGNRGTVYQLSPTGFHIIYTFAGHPDGANPQGNLVLDTSGNLYGTTVSGGTAKTGCNNRGCGTVFKLTPPANGQGLWTETLLYNFTGGTDGSNPQAGVILDSAVNLYGTTEYGGSAGNGTVFELAVGEGGTYTESVLYNMEYGGNNPLGGLTFDSSGNLYATGFGGPRGGGEVYELSPSSGGKWNYGLLYGFLVDSGSTDGVGPAAAVVFDSSGNLYGTTLQGGAYRGGSNPGYGTVYQLTPSSAGWTETILYSFAGGSDGYQPEASVALDSAGDVYGTTLYGGGTRSDDCLGKGCGTAFKLTPEVGGPWTENLFRFPYNKPLGQYPNTPVLLDSAGNVSGTTTSGGTHGDGVIFRITQ